MSEFGVQGRGDVPDNTRAWWLNTLEFLTTYDLDFAYWPLVGYNDTNNNWALQMWTHGAAPAARDGLLDGNDWRRDSWQSLVSAPAAQPPAAPAARWRMLNLDHEDYIKSATLLARGDWDSGARKGACPDGLRLIGLSSGAPARGLCTDASFAAAWNATETVWTNKYVSGADWAGGFTKYQCPPNALVVGYALRGAKVSTVVCAKSDAPLGTASSRTVWFDKGDARADGALGGDFAVSQRKGQCARDEYIAGVAFTTAVTKNGAPAAILCRK